MSIKDLDARSMKVPIFAFCLLLITSVLCANPTSPIVVSEIWFAENGHCMIEICPQALFDYITGFVFKNGDIQVVLPESFVFPSQGEVAIIDVNEIMPDLNFNPTGDTLEVLGQVTEENFFTIDIVKWGTDFINYLSPLQPGQSIVHYIAYDPGGAMTGWCKDAPPTPGTSPNAAVARDTIKIIITDQFGNPVPEIPIFYSDDYFAPKGHTDASGTYTEVRFADRFHCVVRYPHTYVLIQNQTYWLEPNQNLTIPIQINVTANEDNTAPFLPKAGLKAYPSPFNSICNETISFQYDGSTKLHGQSIIKLYDTKGRYVCQIPMSVTGLTSWKPDSNIGSGIYFARLINGNRVLDTKSITLIK